LTLLPTVGFFAALITGIVALAFAGLVGGLVAALVGALLLLPMVVRVGDRAVWREVGLRLVWRRSTVRRASVYRSGEWGPVPDGDYRLPGLLARSRAWPAHSHGTPFALIEHPFSNQWAVALAVNPMGGQLISQAERDIWVARWDAWLAALGREPGIEQVAVVLDQLPDTGSGLRIHAAQAISVDAPVFAARVMQESAGVCHVGQPVITAHVTITFRGNQLQVPADAADPRQAAHTAAVEIGNRLPGLSRSLQATGAGATRPMTVEELAGRVRGWYDPQAQLALAEAAAAGQAPGVTWAQAGPAAAEEWWDAYRHDSGLSRTFEMITPPAGTVLDSVLAPLVEPHPRITRKRVTLLFRPLDAADAPGALDRQVRAALLRANRRAGVINAHDSVEYRAATQAAREEATGAGVVNLAMFVTVTADGGTASPATELHQISEAVTRAGRACRIRLRPVNGAQAAAFAVGLGIGLVPATQSVIPAMVRASL
jgi:hypothetical protein